jgi:NAD(P)H-dependent flavin oxidoreductase YrpB (nitropropane dioxygenase family)
VSGDFVTAAIAAALAPLPEPPINRAARGERSALVELGRAAYRDGLNAEGSARLVTLSQALAFFRLAMLHGVPADAHATVSVLGEIAASCRCLGDMEAGDLFEGQGVSLAELLAEDGDQEMADLIASNASQVTAGAFREAKRLYDLASA